MQTTKLHRRALGQLIEHVREDLEYEAVVASYRARTSLIARRFAGECEELEAELASLRVLFGGSR